MEARMNCKSALSNASAGLSAISFPPDKDIPMITGRDNPVSTPDHMVHWDAEWHYDPQGVTFPRKAICGHLVLLGLKHGGKPFAEYSYHIFEWARKQGAITGFAHMQYLPYAFYPPPDGIPTSLGCCTPLEYPVEVALGTVTFVMEDLHGGDSALEGYYKPLNCGFSPGLHRSIRLSVQRHGTAGSTLTYVRIPNAELTYRKWLDGIAEGRTIVSRNGHNEFLDLRVNGTAQPGAEIRMNEPGPVHARIEWRSIKRAIGTIELVHNGAVVASQTASVALGAPAVFETTVEFRQSGWLAARRVDWQSSSGHRTHAAAVFAITKDAPIRASASDARFYVAWIDNLLKQTSPGGAWSKYFPTGRAAAQQRYREARAICLQRAAEAEKQAALRNSLTPRCTTEEAPVARWHALQGAEVTMTPRTATSRNAPAAVRHRKAAFLISLAALALTLAFAQISQASITGSISGTVTDPSGAVIPAATVVALNTRTGVKLTTSTDSRGFYSFPELSIGDYEILIQKTGFKQYEEKGLIININTVLRVDATLQLGQVSQSVSVSSTTVHVSTTSTQLGQVVTGTKMVTLPLNGRSYTDLLALQPGVAPQPSANAIVYLNPGTVSGNLSPGNLSINGQTESSNGFTVNGADVNEKIYQQTSIIPNLDSIAEFRILTSNFNAEYGNYSGGQIMVVTKSGTNQFHGDAFDFLRNDAFDSRNFYEPSVGSYRQNQFGGTLGGPVRRNKAFFFVDYQGTRYTVGQATGDILVPSQAERAGDMSGEAQQLTGTVGGSFWANTLSQELGYPVAAGEPYYTSGCNRPTQCVFPGAIIPQSAFSAPARHLLQYIPLPNSGPYFTTDAYNETLRDDKGGARYDENTRWGMLSAYYMIDDFTLVNPFAGGLPGFSAQNAGRAQLIALGDTKTFGASTLNEFRMSYMRNAMLIDEPISGQGVGPTLSSLGFVEGANTLGIYPLDPQYEGVPSVSLNEFRFGVSPVTIEQVDDTFELQDNFSKIVGTHALKFGGTGSYGQSNLGLPDAQGNGAFSFAGSETGSDFADFLIGAPSSYAQGSPELGPGRYHYAGLYAQDSWRARRDLTLNYGVRWDFIPFPYMANNEIATFKPGEQSLAFPTAPVGQVYPGDPGVPRNLAPDSYDGFAPRVGLAYSPSASSGILGKITGGPGKSSIRIGYGLFYTQIASVGLQIGESYAPFGLFYTSPVPPLFATPFIDRATGNSEGQRFPAVLAKPPSRSHPQYVDFSGLEPISSQPVIAPNDQVPYTEDFSLSLQRQFGSNTLLTLTYSGAQGHHLIAGLEANPGNPSLCLSVSQPSEVMPGTPTCGPFGENGVYFPVSGAAINGTRAPLGPAFGSDAYYATLGNSNYNALEVTLDHTSGRMTFLGGYTYSKSLDNASGINDQVYPFNYNLTKALSAFDLTNNFVFSYSYLLPFEKLFGHNRLASGWQISGITRFASGFPVTLGEDDDNSLLGTSGSGIGGGVDVPDFTPGNLNITNPRTGRPYFNTSLFSRESLGQFGTASRRFFHGPGENNFDMALLNNFHLTESKTLEFRAEFFNIFNHAQFGQPEGLINSGTFGLVTSALAPRIVQLALKFYF
jgi:hypothetical protein